MKKLISTLVVAGAVLGLAAVSFGQAAGPKQGSAGKQGAGKQGGARQGGNRMARMAKMQEEIFAKLNLTAAQKEKIKAHNKKMAEKSKAMFEEAQKNPGADRQAMMGKFRAMREESDKALKSILTADQYKKFETLRKEARDKARQQFGGRPGGAGGPGAAKRGTGGKKAGGGGN
jgi:Spy/CpxP family protein refolding chaperone